jgi:DNA-binding transcriptional LysR family regulator
MSLDLSHIELRHLRYFVAVAEELHFGRAAARLGMAQPPLSQQIQRLEAALGAPLFERTRRRVQLTAAGQVLLDESRRVLAGVRGALEAAQRAARGETGSLSVAFAASVMFLALPKIIRRFREQFPDVHLELREMPTGPQLAALRARDLDVGFLRHPLPDEALRTETMMREPLVIALSKRHPLAARGHVTVADLAGEDFLLFPRERAPGLHAQVLAVCREAGFSPHVAQVSQELYTTVSLVEAGMGVAIVPASISKMGWRGVRWLRIASRIAETRIDAAWRADNANPVVSAFLDIARAAAGRVVTVRTTHRPPGAPAARGRRSARPHAERAR